MRGFRLALPGAIVAACASLLALGLIDNARSAIFPDLLTEYGLSDTSGSLFYLVVSAFAVFHNLIFRGWIGRTEPRQLLGLYTLLMAVAGLSIALAPSYEWALIAAAVLGCSFGGLGVAQNASVQASVPQVRQRALGVLHSMYGVSSFLAPLLIAACLGMGWRVAFALVAIPAIIIGLAVTLSVSRTKAPAALAEPAAVLPTGRLEALLASLVVAGLVAAETAISSRLPLLGRREWGISPTEASHWLAGFFAAMTVGRVALGMHLLPGSARQLLRLVFVTAIPLLLLALCTGDRWPASLRSALLVLYAIPVALGYPLMMERMAVIFGRKAQAVMAIAVAMQSAAGVLTQFSLGWGGDHFGLQTALVAVAATALVAAAFCYEILERRCGRKPASP